MLQSARIRVLLLARNALWISLYIAARAQNFQGCYELTRIYVLSQFQYKI
jgi:hypothetical protein